MRITILTNGTRGDTQPLIMLAKGLQERGHEVILGARPDFSGLAAQYGIPFAPIGNPYKPFMDDNANNVETGNLVKIYMHGAKHPKLIYENMGEDGYRAAQGSDAIIFKYTWHFGYIIAEKLGIPCAGVMFFPVTPTREFPCFFIGHGKDRGAIGNALVWRVCGQLLLWQPQLFYVNKLRLKLGLKRLAPFFGYHKRQGRENMPVYYAYSTLLLPKPADWPERMRVTGAWKQILPENWSPPADLAAFLENGEAPVYIGFGSMTSNAGRTLAIVSKALELAGKRGVLFSGWAGLGEKAELPDSVFCVGDVPHLWLFPKMAAIVHHGGIGTTMAGLLSGVPSIVVPSLIDQHSWGRQVFNLGLSPEPIPFRGLTVGNLAAAIKTATSDKNMRLRAAEFGKALAGEDGIGYTVDSFLAYVKAAGKK